MNRFIIPIASTALAAGIAIPSYFGRHTIERVVTEPVQTVVREIYHETPVVYTDTVYMAAEDPAPTQPVCVEEHNDYEYNEYNQYNEYNYTDIDVHQRVVVPPQRHEPGWSPRNREQQPRDRTGFDKPQERRDQPNVPGPKPPVRKSYSPVANDRQSLPVPPAQLTKPNPPQRRAPARNANVQVNKAGNDVPKQVPAPSVDTPVAPAAGGVQVSMVQPVRK